MKIDQLMEIKIYEFNFVKEFFFQGNDKLIFTNRNNAF
jgi:hypothetical protein